MEIPPCVVRIAKKVTLERVTGRFVPTITIPELETAVCPAGSVKVSAPPEAEDRPVLNRGKSVSVSPYVVSVVGVETVRSMTGGFVLIITTPSRD